MKLDIITYRKLLPNLSETVIKNFLKYESAIKRYNNALRVLKATEKDYELFTNEMSKYPEEEIKKRLGEILDPFKKIIEEYGNGHKRKEAK